MMKENNYRPGGIGGGGGGGGGRQIRMKMKHFKKGKINSFLNRTHFKQTLGVELG